MGDPLNPAGYLALACDGDGTLLTRKQLASRTARALDRFLACGRKLILVTGETVSQLARFPGLERFDLVVAENGALLYWPQTHKQKLLATPPPPELVRRLRRQKIAPLMADEVIVGTSRTIDGGSGAGVVRLIARILAGGLPSKRGRV